jgi:hypothetical protein
MQLGAILQSPMVAVVGIVLLIIVVGYLISVPKRMPNIDE